MAEMIWSTTTSTGDDGKRYCRICVGGITVYSFEIADDLTDEQAEYVYQSMFGYLLKEFLGGKHP
jgi:hypothetical protein